MRRKRLFEKILAQGNENLKGLGLLEDTYACPVCATFFDVGNLQADELTLEHVPPKSMGGFELLLTCKACNNRSGSAYEAELKNRHLSELDTRAFLNGEALAERPFRLCVDNTTINVGISKDDAGFNIKVKKRHNDPANIEYVFESLRSMEAGASVTISQHRGYVRSKASLADLKTAFLLVTAKFGYSFAFSSKLHHIRGAIHKARHEEVEAYCLSDPIDQEKIYVEEYNGIVIVPTMGRSVVLPWPTISESQLARFPNFIIGQHLNLRAFDLPKSFEGIVDRLGKHKLMIAAR